MSYEIVPGTSNKGKKSNIYEYIIAAVLVWMIDKQFTFLFFFGLRCCFSLDHSKWRAVLSHGLHAGEPDVFSLSLGSSTHLWNPFIIWCPQYPVYNINSGMCLPTTRVYDMPPPEIQSSPVSDTRRCPGDNILKWHRMMLPISDRFCLLMVRFSQQKMIWKDIMWTGSRLSEVGRLNRISQRLH